MTPRPCTWPDGGCGYLPAMSRELVAARALLAELEHVRPTLCDPGCQCDRAKAWAAYDQTRGRERAAEATEAGGS